MSVFDFPRINFEGSITVSPGTANNDDYAQQPAVTMPAEWGPFAGQPFGLIDSKLVRARTFGMSDEAFVAWVQQPQTLQGSNGKPKRVMPAEWNYYGDMSTSAETKVIGFAMTPARLYTQPGESPLIGASLTFSGGMTDINSEGSPPATQFFIDQLTLTSGSNVLVKGRPSKGVSQWLNFYRNVNRTADGGAGGYVYHVLLAGGGTVIDIPGFPPNLRGLVIRYYLYNVQQGDTSLDGQAALYKQKKQNPARLEIAGSITPLRADETILTGPVGRLMVANTATIRTPEGTVNNGGPGGPIALAPAVLQQRGNLVSADFLGTFPDYFQNGQNPKFDFGEVTLAVTGGGQTVTIGPVPYADTAGGNARGWLFDFDLANNAAARQALADPQASFTLANDTYGTVLGETPYFFVSNQQAVYAEQGGPGDRFLNQGTYERATVAVYSRGKLVPRESCPPITVWAYQSTPIQSPGNGVAVSSSFLPGDPIVADVSQPGNLLFTFTINDAGSPPPAGYPPQNYATFSFPPWVTNAPQISVRVLPNDEDFSRYYADPCVEEPVGNERLTFQVVYEKVLRTYYLLFPAMNQIFPLSSEQAVTKFAKAILERTERSLWMTTSYMPRTRDMSASRKKLLRAWCRKVLGTY